MYELTSTLSLCYLYVFIIYFVSFICSVFPLDFEDHQNSSQNNDSRKIKEFSVADFRSNFLQYVKKNKFELKEKPNIRRTDQRYFIFRNVTIDLADTQMKSWLNIFQSINSASIHNVADIKEKANQFSDEFLFFYIFFRCHEKEE